MKNKYHHPILFPNSNIDTKKLDETSRVVLIDLVFGVRDAVRTSILARTGRLGVVVYCVQKLTNGKRPKALKHHKKKQRRHTMRAPPPNNAR